MSGEKNQLEKTSETKSTDEQSSVWAEIARDMAIGAALGSTAGPLGTILGTELGLGYGILTNASEVLDATKKLAESVKEFAGNPLVEEALKSLGQPLTLQPQSRELVEQKGEGIIEHIKNNPGRTALELLFPPLLIYDAVTGGDQK